MRGKKYLESKRRFVLNREDLENKPIIIQVTNLTANDYQNINIYNSGLNRFATNFNLPYTATPVPPFFTPNVTAMAIHEENVDYQQCLANSEQKPFEVGRIMIRVTAGDPTSQLSNQIAIQHVEDTNKTLLKNLQPVFDPYQSKVDRLYVDYNFLLDSLTGLYISQLNASTQIQIYFYLKRRFSGLLTLSDSTWAE